MNDCLIGFSLSIQINSSLPRLAWIVKVDCQNLRVSAVIGDNVEYGPDFLVAGIWDGPFKDGAFENTDAFFGTGLIARGRSVTLVPSAGISDAVYYHVNDTNVLASNSLPLLLAGLNDRLDPRFEFYHRITELIHCGIDTYEKIVPTERGQVTRLFYRNLLITDKIAREVDKPHPPHFRDFSSYFSYITTGYSRVYKNIRDVDRRHTLDIISTQSRGYDTTAVNSIAAKHGVDRAFTVAEAKEGGAFVGTAPRSADIDDGSDICRILGIETIRLDRHAYTTSFAEEYLFYSVSCQADAASLLGIKRWLRRPTVMLTGMLGDIVWATDVYYRQHKELLRSPSKSEEEPAASGSGEIIPDRLGDDFRGPDTWLFGFSEVNLEWGLIQFSPIFIGGRNRPDLYRITMSEEMALWRLGNDYDRPVARRIGEEVGGVPREAFGQKKMAVVTEFPVPVVPIDPALREEYFAFLDHHGIMPLFWRQGYSIIHKINARAIYHTPRHHRYLYYGEQLMSKITRKNVRMPVLYQRLNSHLHCFCANKRARFYEEILSNLRANISALTANDDWQAALN